MGNSVSDKSSPAPLKPGTTGDAPPIAPPPSEVIGTAPKLEAKGPGPLPGSGAPPPKPSPGLAAPKAMALAKPAEGTGPKLDKPVPPPAEPKVAEAAQKFYAQYLDTRQTLVAMHARAVAAGDTAAAQKLADQIDLIDISASKLAKTPKLGVKKDDPLATENIRYFAFDIGAAMQTAGASKEEAHAFVGKVKDDQEPELFTDPPEAMTKPLQKYKSADAATAPPPTTSFGPEIPVEPKSIDAMAADKKDPLHGTAAAFATTGSTPKDKGDALFATLGIYMPATSDKRHIFTRLGVPKEDVELFLTTGKMTPKMAEIVERSKHPPANKGNLTEMQAYLDAVYMTQFIYTAQKKRLEGKYTPEAKQQKYELDKAWLDTVKPANQNHDGWRKEVAREAKVAYADATALDPSDPKSKEKREALLKQSVYQADVVAKDYRLEGEAAKEPAAKDKAYAKAADASVVKGKGEATLAKDAGKPFPPGEVPGLKEAEGDLGKISDKTKPPYGTLTGKVAAAKRDAAMDWAKTQPFAPAIDIPADKQAAIKKATGDAYNAALKDPKKVAEWKALAAQKGLSGKDADAFVEEEAKTYATGEAAKVEAKQYEDYKAEKSKAFAAWPPDQQEAYSTTVGFLVGEQDKAYLGYKSDADYFDAKLQKGDLKSIPADESEWMDETYKGLAEERAKVEAPPYKLWQAPSPPIAKIEVEAKRPIDAQKDIDNAEAELKDLSGSTFSEDAVATATFLNKKLNPFSKDDHVYGAWRSKDQEKKKEAAQAKLFAAKSELELSKFVEAGPKSSDPKDVQAYNKKVLELKQSIAFSHKEAAKAEKERLDLSSTFLGNDKLAQQKELAAFDEKHAKEAYEKAKKAGADYHKAAPGELDTAGFAVKTNDAVALGKKSAKAAFPKATEPPIAPQTSENIGDMTLRYVKAKGPPKSVADANTNAGLIKGASDAYKAADVGYMEAEAKAKADFAKAEAKQKGYEGKSALMTQKGDGARASIGLSSSKPQTDSKLKGAINSGVSLFTTKSNITELEIADYDAQKKIYDKQGAAAAAEKNASVQKAKDAYAARPALAAKADAAATMYDGLAPIYAKASTKDQADYYYGGVGIHGTAATIGAGAGMPGVATKHLKAAKASADAIPDDHQEKKASAKWDLVGLGTDTAIAHEDAKKHGAQMFELDEKGQPKPTGKGVASFDDTWFTTFTTDAKASANDATGKLPQPVPAGVVASKEAAEKKYYGARYEAEYTAPAALEAAKKNTLKAKEEAEETLRIQYLQCATMANGMIGFLTDHIPVLGYAAMLFNDQKLHLKEGQGFGSLFFLGGYLRAAHAGQFEESKAALSDDALAAAKAWGTIEKEYNDTLAKKGPFAARSFLAGAYGAMSGSVYGGDAKKYGGEGLPPAVLKAADHIGSKTPYGKAIAGSATMTGAIGETKADHGPPEAWASHGEVFTTNTEWLQQNAMVIQAVQSGAEIAVTCFVPIGAGGEALSAAGMTTKTMSVIGKVLPSLAGSRVVAASVRLAMSMGHMGFMCHVVQPLGGALLGETLGYDSTFHAWGTFGLQFVQVGAMQSAGKVAHGVEEGVEKAVLGASLGTRAAFFLKGTPKMFLNAVEMVGLPLADNLFRNVVIASVADPEVRKKLEHAATVAMAFLPAIHGELKTAKEWKKSAAIQAKALAPHDPVVQKQIEASLIKAYEHGASATPKPGEPPFTEAHKKAFEKELHAINAKLPPEKQIDVPATIDMIDRMAKVGAAGQKTWADWDPTKPLSTAHEAAVDGLAMHTEPGTPPALLMTEFLQTAQALGLKGEKATAFAELATKRALATHMLLQAGVKAPSHAQVSHLADAMEKVDPKKSPAENAKALRSNPEIAKLKPAEQQAIVDEAVVSAALPKYADVMQAKTADGKPLSVEQAKARVAAIDAEMKSAGVSDSKRAELSEGLAYAYAASAAKGDKRFGKPFEAFSVYADAIAKGNPALATKLKEKYVDVARRSVEVEAAQAHEAGKPWAPGEATKRLMDLGITDKATLEGAEKTVAEMHTETVAVKSGEYVPDEPLAFKAKVDADFEKFKAEYGEKYANEAELKAAFYEAGFDKQDALFAKSGSPRVHSVAEMKGDYEAAQAALKADPGAFSMSVVHLDLSPMAGINKAGGASGANDVLRGMYGPVFAAYKAKIEAAGGSVRFYRGPAAKMEMIVTFPKGVDGKKAMADAHAAATEHAQKLIAEGKAGETPLSKIKNPEDPTYAGGVKLAMTEHPVDPKIDFGDAIDAGRAENKAKLPQPPAKPAIEAKPIDKKTGLWEIPFDYHAKIPVEPSTGALDGGPIADREARKKAFVEKHGAKMGAEKAAALFEKNHPVDKTTGLHTAEQLEPTLKNAIVWAQKNGGSVLYGENDLANLSGTNKAVEAAYKKAHGIPADAPLSKEQEKETRAIADQIFRQVTAMYVAQITAEVKALGGEVHFFRKGGDEFGHVIVLPKDAPKNAQLKLQIATLKAQAAVSAFVESGEVKIGSETLPLRNMVHLKDPTNENKAGTGVTFGLTAVKTPPLDPAHPAYAGAVEGVANEAMIASDTKVEKKKSPSPITARLETAARAGVPKENQTEAARDLLLLDLEAAAWGKMPLGENKKSTAALIEKKVALLKDKYGVSEEKAREAVTGKNAAGEKIAKKPPVTAKALPPDLDMAPGNPELLAAGGPLDAIGDMGVTRVVLKRYTGGGEAENVHGYILVGVDEKTGMAKVRWEGTAGPDHEVPLSAVAYEKMGMSLGATPPLVHHQFETRYWSLPPAEKARFQEMMGAAAKKSPEHAELCKRMLAFGVPLDAMEVMHKWSLGLDQKALGEQLSPTLTQHFEFSCAPTTLQIYLAHRDFFLARLLKANPEIMATQQGDWLSSGGGGGKARIYGAADPGYVGGPLPPGTYLRAEAGVEKETQATLDAFFASSGDKTMLKKAEGYHFAKGLAVDGAYLVAEQQGIFAKNGETIFVVEDGNGKESVYRVALRQKPGESKGKLVLIDPQGKEHAYHPKLLEAENGHVMLNGNLVKAIGTPKSDVLPARPTGMWITEQPHLQALLAQATGYTYERRAMTAENEAAQQQQILDLAASGYPVFLAVGKPDANGKVPTTHQVVVLAADPASRRVQIHDPAWPEPRWVDVSTLSHSKDGYFTPGYRVAEIVVPDQAKPVLRNPAEIEMHAAATALAGDAIADRLVLIAQKAADGKVDPSIGPIVKSAIETGDPAVIKATYEALAKAPKEALAHRTAFVFYVLDENPQLLVTWAKLKGEIETKHPLSEAMDEGLQHVLVNSTPEEAAKLAERMKTATPAELQAFEKEWNAAPDVAAREKALKRFAPGVSLDGAVSVKAGPMTTSDAAAPGAVPKSAPKKPDGAVSFPLGEYTMDKLAFFEGKPGEKVALTLSIPDAMRVPAKFVEQKGKSAIFEITLENGKTKKVSVPAWELLRAKDGTVLTGTAMHQLDAVRADFERGVHAGFSAMYGEAEIKKPTALKLGNVVQLADGHEYFVGHIETGSVVVARYENGQIVKYRMTDADNVLVAEPNGKYFLVSKQELMTKEQSGAAEVIATPGKKPYVVLRTADAGDTKSFGLMIWPGKALDGKGAFKDVEIDGSAMDIKVGGKPLADLRGVAMFGAHGNPFAFAGLSNKEAAGMIVEQILRANAGAGGKEPIRYCLLNSCGQGTKRFYGVAGKTNAAAVQTLINEALAARGIDPKGPQGITVLAADQPGSVTAATTVARFGKTYTASWVPAAEQDSSKHLGTRDYLGYAAIGAAPLLIGGVSGGIGYLLGQWLKDDDDEKKKKAKKATAK
ncbi:MAG: hypothetical protein IT381_26420 [Deltaproteobacteria bacterium]|nr:hypothetical protein [Deltaproteobacteria bacterium]